MDSDLLNRFEDGIMKFNRREFYECHDVLEDVWFDVRGDSRRFYQGLIHLAVGFYHLTSRNNLNGTLSQLNKGISKLAKYAPEFQGVELKKLLKRVEGCVEDIQKLREGKMEKFNEAKIPKIEFRKQKFSQQLS